MVNMSEYNHTGCKIFGGTSVTLLVEGFGRVAHLTHDWLYFSAIVLHIQGFLWTKKIKASIIFQCNEIFVTV